MEPRGGVMLGMSRAVRGDEFRGYELLILRPEASGLAYEAHPSGQRPATFPATAISDRELVFDNPEHDFPQRIAYTRVGADSVVARTYGEVVAVEPALVLRYGRVPCVSEPTHAAEAELLAAHERILAAHRERDVEAWLALEADDYVSANGGEIRFPTKRERRAARQPYLESTTFTTYRDARPPMVGISDDGTSGWLIAQVETAGTRTLADGRQQALEAVYAWIELYRRVDGRWLVVGNVSNTR